MTATDTVAFGDQTFTYDSLYTLSGPDLAKLHNKVAPTVGVETTKRFSDKVAAVKRTWAVLQKAAGGATIASPVPEELADKLHVGDAVIEHNEKAEKSIAKKAEKQAKAPKEPKVKKEAAPRKPRGKRFVWKPLDELKKVRPDTHRAKLVELLSREQGATFNQCLASTWGKEEKMDEATQIKTCYEAMRLLHYYVGYGMRHLDDSANPHIQIYFK